MTELRRITSEYKYDHSKGALYFRSDDDSPTWVKWKNISEK